MFTRPGKCHELINLPWCSRPVVWRCWWPPWSSTWRTPSCAWSAAPRWASSVRCTLAAWSGPLRRPGGGWWWLGAGGWGWREPVEVDWNFFLWVWKYGYWIFFVPVFFQFPQQSWVLGLQGFELNYGSMFRVIHCEHPHWCCWLNLDRSWSGGFLSHFCWSNIIEICPVKSYFCQSEATIWVTFGSSL